MKPFTGLVFDENGQVIGCSYYFINPDRQVYQNFLNMKAYKRAKFNDSWSNWIEIIEN